jgi:hypothetical protein
MKSAFIGAAAIAAAAVATPALAQGIITNPRACAQFDHDANCLRPGPGNPDNAGSYDRYRQSMDAVTSPQAVEPNAHRYHGGPKYND